MQFPADLVTFTEEILNGNRVFLRLRNRSGGVLRRVKTYI